jgi:hypothetical protein
MNVSGADHNLNLVKLRKKGYDSVFAPRGSKTSNGVMNDEFVIYDPDQAIVEYIVHYSLGSSTTPTLPAMMPRSSTTQVSKKEVFTKVALRSIKYTDPLFMAALHAEGHFYKMTSKSIQQKTVKSVTVIQNSKLLNAFDAKKKEFKKNKIPSDPIYAHHGTVDSPTIMDNILKDNFDMKFAKRQAHGPGHYFSEYSDVSLNYGPGLIFCQLLSGKEFQGGSQTWPGYHSKVTRYYGGLCDPAFIAGCAASQHRTFSDGDREGLGSNPASLCHSPRVITQHFCTITSIILIKFT